ESPKQPAPVGHPRHHPRSQAGQWRGDAKKKIYLRQPLPALFAFTRAQRATAAFLATERRSSAVMRSSRAFPPCRPNTRAASMSTLFGNRLDEARFFLIPALYQPLSRGSTSFLDGTMTLAYYGLSIE